MIILTECKELFNNYSGSEKKKTLIYNGRNYLVKFPDPIKEKNKNILFKNNVVSEYVGSHIFELCGFDTQKTILGKYIYNGKEKIVCACEDFTNDNYKLKEFKLLALSMNPDKKTGTNLDDILKVIDESNMINSEDTKKRFFDMFIIDALIGNTDRHNGNWGFIAADIEDNIKFSPIYDCGSCLNPMLEDSELKKLSDSDIKNLALNCYSVLKIDDKKINYMNYIESITDDNVNDALVRVLPNIDIDSINDFIDNIDCMSKIRREFYKKLITFRYNILKKVYKRLKGD